MHTLSWPDRGRLLRCAGVMFWRNRPATRRLAQAWADLRVWPHRLLEEGTYFSDQVRATRYKGHRMMLLKDGVSTDDASSL